MIKHSIAQTAEALVATAALSLAFAVDSPDATASLIQKDLFFGRNIPGGGEVSEAEFAAFVDGIITPRFPAGLTIFDADGQFRDSTGNLIEEQSKLVTLFVEDTPVTETAIREIVTAYLQQFNQESVLQVTNEDELKVGFGAGENLIDNDLIPEFIQADLFFGRNIPTGGEVSEEQFQSFVDREITPRFPAGLTIFDADGQFRNSSGTIIEEQSKAVTLLFEDTQNNETAIDEIIVAYIQQFNQESVLLAVNEEVAVGFGAGEDLIDNDLIPEFIQADLFFGRNIPTGGEVSEEQFQSFVDREITPRFPAGLTIFDVDGQFRDSTGTIIEEQSKVVTLLFEDTQNNETAIDEIILAYTRQFNQESVLLVVDEDVSVAFDVSPPASVAEPTSSLGLLMFGSLGAGFMFRRKLFPKCR
jgi:mannose/fructose-specific phosphotransferase system component IIA